MILDVVLTRRAQSDLEQAFEWWTANRSKEQAERWYAGFVLSILRLSEEPKRWPTADENPSFPIEIHQLNFGLRSTPTHRAIYTVRPDTVVVLRVRHLAQVPLSPEDV